MREVEPTHWTPEQGPARNTVERATHHVWRHKLLWYIALVVSLSLSLQLAGVHS